MTRYKVLNVVLHRSGGVGGTFDGAAGETVKLVGLTAHISGTDAERFRHTALIQFWIGTSIAPPTIELPAFLAERGYRLREQLDVSGYLYAVSAIGDYDVECSLAIELEAAPPATFARRAP